MTKAKALRPAEVEAQPQVEPSAATADLVCTHTSVRRAARRLGLLCDEAIAPTGLTSSQALLLAQIDALSMVNGQAWSTLRVLTDRLAIRVRP